MYVATEREISDNTEATRFSQCAHDQRRRLEAEDCNSIRCAQLISGGRRRTRPCPPYCLAHARPTMCCIRLVILWMWTNRVRTVDRALLFCALQADFADFSVVCYVGLVYPRPRFGLLSRGEAVRDEPAQYISMRAPETTVVVPNGSHYRDSQYSRPARCTARPTVSQSNHSKTTCSYLDYDITTIGNQNPDFERSRDLIIRRGVSADCIPVKKFSWNPERPAWQSVYARARPACAWYCTNYACIIAVLL